MRHHSATNTRNISIDGSLSHYFAEFTYFLLSELNKEWNYVGYLYRNQLMPASKVFHYFLALFSANHRSFF